VSYLARRNSAEKTRAKKVYLPFGWDFKNKNKI
jgi:hypothetical protein